MENQQKKQSYIEGYIFVGCMFIGMGIDSAIGNSGVGLMVGMGVGFLASAIYTSEKNK